MIDGLTTVLVPLSTRQKYFLTVEHSIYITLHAGYNLLCIFSILYGTYNAAQLMDPWKGLLEFVSLFTVS